MTRREPKRGYFQNREKYMQNQARVVIIGGGITGCSIAYHLAKLGWTDVMLVDKGELTSGSTWHAAGLVTQFHTSPTLMRMRIYSVNLYRHLQAETGPSVGWHEVGSLRLASSPDHFKFLQRQIGQAKALGMEVEMIPPAEACRLFPYMSTADLYGALYIPGDGHLEPSGVTLELARRAKQMGVAIHTGVRVTGFKFSPAGEVKQVWTDHGLINTEVIVNAAGMWARQVGAMAGINLPMVPLSHQHLTTRPIPSQEIPHQTPVLRDPYYLFYLREEVRGFLIGGFERSPKAWSVEGVPWDFTQKLLPPDWELFDEIMEGAIRRVPMLAQAEVLHLVNGPEAITPDSRPLVGPVPGRRGFYIAAGLSHTGFGAGGALGEIIAGWITAGEPPYNVSELNVRRFGPVYETQSYVTERARESYKYYYELRYPHDENEWARPLRLSPVDTRLRELGAVFGEKNGWERVNHFEPGQLWRRAGADQKNWGWGPPPFFEQVGLEHQAVREQAALFDLTSFGKIEVTGPGALAFLQRLADNNIARPVGSVIYTQFLNERGGIESDLTITRLADDRFRIITGSNFVAGDLGWLNMHLPDDGSVELHEVTDAWACLALWGPQARAILQAVSGDDVSNQALPYMSARSITLAGAAVLAARVSYVGELGWELYVRPDQAGLVWDTLMAVGQPFGLRPGGYKALDSLRLEKGYRYWSTDITPTDNPLEAGLGFCVRFDKGDFIGREALLKLKAQRLQQRLCTLTLGGAIGFIYGGEPIYVNGRIAGRLRSGGYGYTVGKNIGLAYLPVELAKPGTQLEVGVFGERIPAEVATDVLYDSQGVRLRT
jgi:4-methylaminobutanoate oxidase (formaldehyde-forming)